MFNLITDQASVSCRARLALHRASGLPAASYLFRRARLAVSACLSAQQT